MMIICTDYKNQGIARGRLEIPPSLPKKGLKIINANSTVSSCLPFLLGPCIFLFSLYFAFTTSQIIYQTRATMFITYIENVTNVTLRRFYIVMNHSKDNFAPSLMGK